MKQLKIWSMMMLMVLIIPTKAYTQEVDIDERDLVGSWNRVEAQGTFDGYPYVSGPVAMRFKDATSQYSDSTAVLYYYNNDNQLTKYGACDYFISKNNTLHFISSGSYRYSTRFKIKAYDGNKLTLETFSGNGTLILSKVVPSSVSAPQRENVPDDKYYTIDGKQLPSAPRRGVYINNKKKYIK